MKKIKEILIGTHNKGKIKEISYLLNKKIKKITPFELNLKSPKETGNSFKSNSELKAKYFYNKSKISTISDDSGLCVDCLNDKPGIYSARWAKKYGSFELAMEKIIELIKKKNKKKKKKKL
jgi:XTP/dITP diphosphohydrolase